MAVSLSETHFGTKKKKSHFVQRKFVEIDIFKKLGICYGSIRDILYHYEMKNTEEELGVGMQLSSYILSALHLWVHQQRRLFDMSIKLF